MTTMVFLDDLLLNIEEYFNLGSDDEYTVWQKTGKEIAFTFLELIDKSARATTEWIEPAQPFALKGLALGIAKMDIDHKYEGFFQDDDHSVKDFGTGNFHDYGNDMKFYYKFNKSMGNEDYCEDIAKEYPYVLEEETK